MPIKRDTKTGRFTRGGRAAQTPSGTSMSLSPQHGPLHGQHGYMTTQGPYDYRGRPPTDLRRQLSSERAQNFRGHPDSRIQPRENDPDDSRLWNPQTWDDWKATQKHLKRDLVEHRRASRRMWRNTTFRGWPAEEWRHVKSWKEQAQADYKTFKKIYWVLSD